MKLVMVGAGYVGLVSGACFAEFGFETVCVDKDKSRIEKIEKGSCPFFEPGMDDLLIKHTQKTKLLSFTTSLADAMQNANIVFITVGTPSRRIEDEADLSAIWDVSHEIAKNIKNYCVIVTKSTVPVGTTKKIKKIIETKISSENFGVVSNPEFLREGSAINDFMRPDRVVIGTESKKSEKLMRDLYRPLNLIETPIVSTTIETSEVIKYASNSFLATKIGFINQVADLCEAVGANVQDVAKGMGIDKRIGAKFLHAGPGFGGSCFPKDVKAFAATAKKFNINFSILDAVKSSNEKRPQMIVKKILDTKKFDSNSSIALLGLSFKPNTDDIRDSTSLKIASILQENNIKVNCYDPVAMVNAQQHNKTLNFFDSVYDACEGVNAIIIGTEWNEFRALNFTKIKEKIKDAIIFDLRNIYRSAELEELGFSYYGIGK
jgi:UDPglucose 6-dehydrogenase